MLRLQLEFSSFGDILSGSQSPEEGNERLLKAELLHSFLLPTRDATSRLRRWERKPTKHGTRKRLRLDFTYHFALALKFRPCFLSKFLSQDSF